MSLAAFKPLVGLTLRDPRAAARQIMAMDLPRHVSWSALFLAAAVTTLVLQVMIGLSPAETRDRLPSYFDAPLAVFLLLAGLMVIYVHAVFWAGRVLSGTGRLDDLLALMVWLMVLRAGVQVITLVLTLTLPPLAGLLSILALVWAFWILLSFVAEALVLPSLGHALMALLIGVVGLFLGVGMLLAVILILAGGAVNV